MDAQMTKLLAKQEELLDGQRAQGAEIASMREMLELLTHAVGKTNETVAALRDQIVPPLHNAMHDNTARGGGAYSCRRSSCLLVPHISALNLSRFVITENATQLRPTLELSHKTA